MATRHTSLHSRRSRKPTSRFARRCAPVWRKARTGHHRKSLHRGRQSGGSQTAAGKLARQGQDDLYRSAVQHRQRLHLCRRFHALAGTTKDGTAEIMGLFDGKKVFDYPQPVKLLRRLIRYGVPDGGIVMDFFSGSATTAHAHAI